MVTKPVARPKGWRRPNPQPQVKASEPAKTDELPTTAAPGHQGGSFQTTGYIFPGRGVFGFRQDPL